MRKGAAKAIFKFKPTLANIVIGEAYVLLPTFTSVPRYWVSDRELADEIRRFKDAIHVSKEQINRIKSKMCRFGGDEHLKILESHAMILQDETLFTQAANIIASQRINAEWAVEKTLNKLKLAFADISEEYFQERKDDIEYVGRRILKNLQGSGELNVDGLERGKKYILIAHDLSPADVASLPRDRVVGFITAVGGDTSHTAIIARSLELPAILGRPDIVNLITSGDMVVIDGLSGDVVVNPSPQLVSEYKRDYQRHRHLEQELLKSSHFPATTTDGRTIGVVANIDLLEEASSAIEHGAEGIGLYRTEFMFTRRAEYPNEDKLTENYESLLKMMAPKVVTIRTLDMGGEKLFYSERVAPPVKNPALGLRAIRFSLLEKELFVMQMRAILRANKHNNLRVMIPMLTDLGELREVKGILKEIESDLRKKGVDFSSSFKLGVMIEVPSAALIADSLAKEVDFFSIGTNDLIQYTLATDRTDENVSYLFKPLHPAVLQLIKKTVDAAKKTGIDVTVCGEMAGDPLYLAILIGLGVDTLSVNPISVPRVKRVIRRMKYSDLVKLAQNALISSTAEEVEELIKEKMPHIFSNLFEEDLKFTKPAKGRKK